MAGGGDIRHPFPLIFNLSEMLLFLSKNIFIKKYNIWGWKSPILTLAGIYWEKYIKFSAHYYLICQKFATSCLHPNFLTHDAAGGARN